MKDRLSYLDCTERPDCWVAKVATAVIFALGWVLLSI